MDTVAISFLYGEQPCVELFWGFFHGGDSDVFGKVAVCVIHNFGDGFLGFQIDICYLAEGVDACVGAAGALHFCRFSF